MHPSTTRQGFVLVTVLAIMAVLAILAAAYFLTTNVELTSSASNANRTTGFYAAEAGLNLRGEAVKQIFQGYNLPAGTSPSTTAPCTGSNLGSGDFACQDFTLSGRTVRTYVVEDPSNATGGTSVTLGPNEQFAGLNAIEYRYTVYSEAIPPNDTRPEAIVQMVFRSRLVPLFQFAAFYNKDLEILPGPNMTINGRVHANGDLYLNSDSTLDITGQVTVAKRADGSGGDLYRGRKDTTFTCNGTVRIDDANSSTNPDPAVPCLPGAPTSVVTDLSAWNGQVQTGLNTLTVPAPNQLDPGNTYWKKADLVVSLEVNSSGQVTGIMVPNRTLTAGSMTENSGLTSTLLSCPARDTGDLAYDQNGTAPSAGAAKAIDWSNSFYDNREGKHITMLEVDMGGLLDCLHQNPTLFADSSSKEQDINDTSDGGLALYFTVNGPASGLASSGYGVRIRDGKTLASSVPGAPAVKGVTVITDQAVYVQGDYNVDGSTWRPASFLSDSLNVLSDAWNKTGHDQSTQPSAATNNGWSGRTAQSTEIDAAFLSGTDTTGGADGTAGQTGAYNGGLENYPRFHENWSGKTLTYQGSFVSLGDPRHADGPWSYGAPVYTAPNRNWSFDTRFYNPADLPPLAPRFVYLKQERFVRSYVR